MLERNAKHSGHCGDSQFAGMLTNASQHGSGIALDQFQTSIRESWRRSLADRETNWLDRNKPSFDISGHFAQSEVPPLQISYDAIFDMITYAFETDLTTGRQCRIPGRPEIHRHRRRESQLPRLYAQRSRTKIWSVNWSRLSPFRSPRLSRSA